MAQQQAFPQIVKKYGPYGSKLPENYSFQLAEGEHVTEVLINHGPVVNSIGFVVQKPYGTTYTVKFGGDGGTRHSKILLMPGEVLTRISGSYGMYGDKVVIGSITIHTNLNKKGYGPYGDGKTDPVDTFTSPELFMEHFVGIFGRANDYVESIGVFAKTDRFPN